MNTTLPIVMSVRDACTAEVITSADLILSDPSGSTAVARAIGQHNRVLAIATQAAARVQSALRQQGPQAARAKLFGFVPGLCQRAGNPIVTRRQIVSLQLAALPDDANLLSNVKVFS